jgi:hypothetical protein
MNSENSMIARLTLDEFVDIQNAGGTVTYQDAIDAVRDALPEDTPMKEVEGYIEGWSDEKDFSFNDDPDPDVP